MHNSKAGTALEEKKSQLKNRYLNKGKSTMVTIWKGARIFVLLCFSIVSKKTCCKDDHFSNQ